MLLRLTKQGSPVLVNFNNVTNCEVFTTPQGNFTKIYLVGGIYVNVEESMEDILNLQLNHLNGHYQETTCPVPTINERFENTYNNSNRQFRPRRRRTDVTPTNDNIW